MSQITMLSAVGQTCWIIAASAVFSAMLIFPVGIKQDCPSQAEEQESWAKLLTCREHFPVKLFARDRAVNSVCILLASWGKRRITQNAGKFSDMLRDPCISTACKDHSPQQFKKQNKQKTTNFFFLEGERIGTQGTQFCSQPHCSGENHHMNPQLRQIQEFEICDERRVMREELLHIIYKVYLEG